MRAEDLIRVRHMVDAAETAAAFLAGRSRADLQDDKMLQFALVRAVEIVGEAASKVSNEARAMNPGIPWHAIVGMRNRLVHAYFDVDKDILWVAATREIPALLVQLRAIAGQD